MIEYKSTFKLFMIPMFTYSQNVAMFQAVNEASLSLWKVDLTFGFVTVVRSGTKQNALKPFLAHQACSSDGLASAS